jgi:hypothetical protein
MQIGQTILTEKQVMQQSRKKLILFLDRTAQNYRSTKVRKLALCVSTALLEICLIG